jgi:hypothetical protein
MRLIGIDGMEPAGAAASAQQLTRLAPGHVRSA